MHISSTMQGRAKGLTRTVAVVGEDYTYDYTKVDTLEDTQWPLSNKVATQGEHEMVIVHLFNKYSWQGNFCLPEFAMDELN